MRGGDGELGRTGGATKIAEIVIGRLTGTLTLAAAGGRGGNGGDGGNGGNGGISSNVFVTLPAQMAGQCAQRRGSRALPDHRARRATTASPAGSPPSPSPAA